MYVCMSVCISLSLSLYVYIYIYVYVYVHRLCIVPGSRAAAGGPRPQKCIVKHNNNSNDKK